MLFALLFFSAFSAAAPATPLSQRVASFSISQDFLNDQITSHVKSELVRDLRVTLDTQRNQILLTGTAQVPLEELRAINLEPSLGKFHFQVAARLATTRRGHLILEFPLNETYFYPATSPNPERDRVIVPVQMLSIALASARGYLAAISGDFSGFEQRTQRLELLQKALDRSIRTEKNPNAVDDLKTQRESIRLQLAAIPLERKQLEALAKQFAAVVAFTGEKEMNLNQELAARRNALVLKLKLSQLTPYLKGVELGGVHLWPDKKDGAQNYFTVDLDGQIEGAPSAEAAPGDSRAGLAHAPALVVRIAQAVFESKAVRDSEKAKLGSHIQDLRLSMEDDGLHVKGSYKLFLFFHAPFETVVDFSSVAPDVFEARVREIKLGGSDFRFLAKFALESLQQRLDTALKGICHFQYVGEETDHSHALRVTVDPKALVPAFPDLHLIDVDVRAREFVLKVGKI